MSTISALSKFDSLHPNASYFERFSFVWDLLYYSRYGYEDWQLDKKGRLIEQSKIDNLTVSDRQWRWIAMQRFPLELQMHVDIDGDFCMYRISASGRTELIAKASTETLLVERLEQVYEAAEQRWKTTLKAEIERLL